MALRTRAHCRVETFGLADGSDWQAHDLVVSGTSTSFRVRRGGVPAGSFEVPLLGAYNVRNALAAIAVGAAVGLSTDTMTTSLRRFKGVRRRLQHRGTARGVAVYDDFAHHPTAIGETLAGVRSAARSGGSGRSSSRVRPPPAGVSSRRTLQGPCHGQIASSSRLCSDRRCRMPNACRPINSSQTSRPRASTRAISPAPMTSSAPCREKPGTATWSSSCRTAGSTTFIASC